LLFSVPTFVYSANEISNRLSGKILLQVEANGEGWYIYPKTLKRYYLGRPSDAFRIMRELSLGISNNDFDSFGDYAPYRLRGLILLKVEDSGKAYYVHPDTRKIYYLGRPNDAFNVMRTQGLGISNNDLSSIAVSDSSNVPIIKSENQNETPFITTEDKQNLVALINGTPKVNKTIFLTDWHNNEYSVSIDIPLEYYLYYKNKPHNMGSNFENLTAFITPDDYYINLLLQQIDDFNMKAIGSQTAMIINPLEKIVQSNYYISDWHSGFDEYPKYPIETIFEGNGDCEDLSFLLATMLKSTSDNIYYGIRAPYYSISLIRFPNHLGVGLSYENSETKTAEENFNYILNFNPETKINGYYQHNAKKYFYIESTNTEFEFGEIPLELKGQEVQIYPLPYIDALLTLD